MKDVVIKILKKALKEKEVKMNKEEIAKLIEIPPSYEMGDFAFPCFFLSAKLKDSPHQIALEIREKIEFKETDFDDVQTKGAYINFFLNRQDLARKVVWEAITKKKNYGKSKIGHEIGRAHV